GSFVLAVLFAFFTNRLFVFSERGNFWVDMVLFFASRIVSTLVFEFGAMYVLINLLQQNRELSKFFGSFLVTIANYFISKYFVFRKRGKA
ncbi:MAG: GtrA family protein, partial [Clostridiaceae bacterium]|nr:GtrA family protein [Clostridiaceae bacterium]